MENRRLKLFLAIIVGTWLTLFLAEVYNIVATFRNPGIANLSIMEYGDPGHPYPKLINIEGKSGRWSGDLASMLTSEKLQKKYNTVRPSISFITDKYGYRNKPVQDDTYSPIVVAGDSYFIMGSKNEDTFSSQLASKLNVNVYNMSFPGRGAVKPVAEFLKSERFSKRPPKLLILGFTERCRNQFIDDIKILDYRAQPSLPRRIRNTIFWPQSLNGFLLQCSLVKKWAFKLKDYATTEKSMAASLDVMPVDTQNKHILFYKPELDVIKALPEGQTIDGVTEGILRIKKECDMRGIKLVLLPVPGKGYVYRDYLQMADKSFILPKEQFIDKLEFRLEGKGVYYINILPKFDELAVKEKRELFWRDDTHWNDLGINVAASETAQYIKQHPELKAAIMQSNTNPLCLTTE